MLDPLLSIKRARESSWSLDSSGIEKSPLFPGPVGNADPGMEMEGGFSWLCVCSCRSGRCQTRVGFTVVPTGGDTFSLMQWEMSFERCECQSIRNSCPPQKCPLGLGWEESATG